MPVTSHSHISLSGKQEVVFLLETHKPNQLLNLPKLNKSPEPVIAKLIQKKHQEVGYSMDLTNLLVEKFYFT